MGLRDQLVSEISRLLFEGLITGGTKLPSCRGLARDLGVSINTVVAAYQVLEEQRLIKSRARSGFYACENTGKLSRLEGDVDPGGARSAQVSTRLNHLRRTDGLRTISRPHNWYDYKFPFVCNQVGEAQFPVVQWRECTRRALNRRDLRIWSSDHSYEDSPDLVRQVNQRILPRRGIAARKGDTLITLGSQNGLYITSQLFGGHNRVAVMEDPGYPDARKILQTSFGSVKFQPIDKEGMIVDERLKGVDLVVTTPNRQLPTTVTMSENRRRELLTAAEEYDFFIIEDDYECDVDYRRHTPLPLRARDETGRVVYLGSLSKGLSPGLRLGYMVGPTEFIRAARDYRGIVLRHPPMILQHTTAEFISLGYYDGLLQRLHKEHEAAWEQADAAIHQHLPDFRRFGDYGGTVFVLGDPQSKLCAQEIARKSLEYGVIVEPIWPCFHNRDAGKCLFRLGVSSIKRSHIDEGIQALALAIANY